jgi:hypothetical protein
LTVAITLPNDLEQFLQTHAQNVGIPVETLLTRTIVERWSGVRHAPGLPTRETALLLRLQTLFPPEQTHEYQALVQQSDAGTLTEPDREPLLSLIEQRDNLNAERLEIVAELAELRGVSLREMMAEHGIGPD